MTANRLFRPKLRDSDNSEKRDGPIRELLRQRAFERLYRPHAAPQIVDKHPDLYDVAVETIGKETPATILEFGVAHGRSMGLFAERFTSPDTRFIGFDSFVGLPEAWLMHDAGAFSNRGVPPAIADHRVSFVKGWFQNTVPGYLDRFEYDPTRTYLIHYDADLYSSTLFLLTSIWCRIPEYYFIMDDFTQDDMSALFDFALAYPIEVEFIAQTRGGDGTGPPVPAQVFGRMRRIHFEPDDPAVADQPSIIPNPRVLEESLNSPRQPVGLFAGRADTGPLAAASAKGNEAAEPDLQSVRVPRARHDQTETGSLPIDRLEGPLLRLDDGGTRVRRALLALEDIYNPRPAPLTFSNKNELYTAIAKAIGDVPLTYLEFGVWQGASIKLMAQKFSHPKARFVGFDSFEGCRKNGIQITTSVNLALAARSRHSTIQESDLSKGGFRTAFPVFVTRP